MWSCAFNGLISAESSVSKGSRSIVHILGESENTLMGLGPGPGPGPESEPEPPKTGQKKLNSGT